MATLLWIVRPVLVISGIFAIVRQQFCGASSSSWSASLSALEA